VSRLSSSRDRGQPGAGVASQLPVTGIAPSSASSLTLFGLSFDNLSMHDAVYRLDRYITSGIPHMVFTANVSMLAQWRQSQHIQQIYHDSDLVTVDGMALVYASRLLGTPFRAPLSGSLLFYELMSLAQVKGYSVFLLGADADTVRAARRRLEEIYPPVRIVGTHNGYFGIEQSWEIADLIRKANPDILLLGMSSPLKERFAWAYRHYMNVPLILGVGGMFDIMAGRRRFAPNWVRLLCLEWLWRLAQEPRRLGRRYATTNALFICLLAREMFRSRIVGPVIRRVAHRRRGVLK
jgi:N-acetylglucosaminyldiphosphoundecaprenol N-acetyl-beta-D-mannosaminyltransferase